MLEIRTSYLCVGFGFSDWLYKLLGPLWSFVSHAFRTISIIKKNDSFKLDLLMFWENWKNKVHLHIGVLVFLLGKEILPLLICFQKEEISLENLFLVFVFYVHDCCLEVFLVLKQKENTLFCTSILHGSTFLSKHHAFT